MEHYNLLYAEGKSPGLYIARANEDDSLDQQLSTTEEYIGDFYSNVPCEELADRIFQILGEASLTKGVVVTDSCSFNGNYDPFIDYVIKENNRVRIYLPEAEGTNQNIKEAYQDFSAYFLEALFSDQKEGSIQREFRELEKFFTDAIVKIEELDKKIKESMRGLRDELLVAEALSRPRRGKQVLN